MDGTADEGGAGDGFFGGTGGGTDDVAGIVGTGAVCERSWGLGESRLADLDGPRSAAAAAPRLMKDLNSYFAT